MSRRLHRLQTRGSFDMTGLKGSSFPSSRSSSPDSALSLYTGDCSDYSDYPLSSTSGSELNYAGSRRFRSSYKSRTNQVNSTVGYEICDDLIKLDDEQPLAVLNDLTNSQNRSTTNVMFHHARYKTELCRQWMELGKCDYMERCLYAHGEYEIKPMRNRHPKYKTVMCSAFHNDGFCSFGPRCSFIHTKINGQKLLEEIAANIPKMCKFKSNSDLSDASDLWSNSTNSCSDSDFDQEQLLPPIDETSSSFNATKVKRSEVFRRICPSPETS